MEVQEIDFDGLSGFADLPMEIILNIFRYLNFGDIQSASLACRRWCDAAQDPEFRSKVLLKFTETHLSDDNFPGSVFLNTFRSFPYIYLQKINLGVVKTLFNHIGQTVEHIVFDEVNITEEEFTSIVKETPNLKALSVIGSLSVKRQVFNSEAGRELLAKSLRNIREITIKKNRRLTDVILHLSTSLPPNLERITFDSVPSFKVSLNVIEAHVSTLKELDLSITDYEDDDRDFSSLANIKGLDLWKLVLKSCSTLNSFRLELLLKSQKNLVELNLSKTAIRDSSVELICDHLTNLEALKFEWCARISKSNVVGLSKLKRLKVLDISGCNLSSDGVEQGIAKIKNYTVLELYLNDNSELSEACLIRCAENFPNLRVFDISYCKEVTDRVVQAIIKNLTWLRFLGLNGCDLITDAGLTGINVKAKLSKETDRSCSSSDEEYEVNPLDGLIQDGLSIKELKGLKTLKLKRCSKITNASLIYGLQFLELKNLDLAWCNNISVTGIQALVENCPSIELLNISCCRNINKECIEVISQRLQRLQFLGIAACFQLINHFDYVVTNCKALRILDLDSINRDRTIQKIQQSGVNLCRNLRLPE